jgi:hypothetical protein
LLTFSATGLSHTPKKNNGALLGAIEADRVGLTCGPFGILGRLGVYPLSFFPIPWAPRLEPTRPFRVNALAGRGQTPKDRSVQGGC